MSRHAVIDLCGAERAGEGSPRYLGRDAPFPFRCVGCGGCCRQRGDIVLSGYDLYRLARQMRLPPKIAARAFCKVYIGQVSRLPVAHLAPAPAEGGNCPFLTGGRCAVHEARPLVCALYPLGQEISPDRAVRYYAQDARCGLAAPGGTAGGYLAAQGVLQREGEDVLWAVRCMALERQAPGWEAALGPVTLRRMQAKLAEALYYRYDTARPWAEQFEANLAWLAGQRARLEEMQRTIDRKNR